ncbi:MAG: DEAD/DEAH box helicase [Endozoicomonadaceae bacterium]|nr:DEAD/DEAH box helicase [Endozoicomonadaceae bacterium]
MSTKYGLTWWGAQWLHAFKGIDYTNRIPRGHTYAGNGSVQEINMEGCAVNACVKGSRRKPYDIEIKLPAFNSQQQTIIVNTVSQSPPVLSKLINRQLPNSLLSLLEKEDIYLFPKSWDDMQASCSCPDWAMPCKHIAAVIYLIASEIDKNPFTVFHLHDMSLPEAIEKRTGLNVVSLDKPPKYADKWQKTPLENNTSSTDHAPDALDLTLIPPMQERIFTILPEISLFYHTDFRKIMADVYKRAAKYVTAKRKQISETEKCHDVTDFKTLTLILSRRFNFSALKSDEKTLVNKSSADLYTFFQTLSCEQSTEITRHYPHTMLWYNLFHLSMKLVEQQAIIPEIYQQEDGRAIIRWKPAMLSEPIQSLVNSLYVNCPVDLVVIQHKKPKSKTTTLFSDQKTQIEAALHVLISFFIRQGFLQTSGKFENNICQLFFDQEPYYCDDFSAQQHPSVIRNWLSRLSLTEREHRLYLLVEECDQFLSVDIRIQQNNQMLSLAQCFSDNKLSGTKVTVLADLAILAEYLPEIEKLYEKKQSDTTLFYSLEHFTPVFLNILPVLKMLGIQLILPKSLRDIAYPKLSLSLSKSNSDNPVNYLQLDDLLSFNWQIAIGDKRIPVEEFKKLVEGATGLIKIVDQYVMLDNTKLQQLLKKLTKLPESLSRTELLKAALSGELDGAPIDIGNSAKKLFEELLREKPVPLPANLQVTLRPYQERGFQWMAQNARIGFGSLLADDMGLGKTLQVITLLLHQKQNGLLEKHKALVVAPTSLLTNWRKEIENFAPSMQVIIYHGSKRTVSHSDYDIMLTSYGLVRSDSTTLSKLKWQTLVIDEAQNIKNPGSLQTKAIKKLRADVRIGMSGTPVENRLKEYWSLFDFSNRSYLGTQKKFNEEFSRPIEQDGDKHALNRFKKITAPFILRRLKTDKSIISDLPDKIESNRYCTLSKEQTALYQSTVDSMMEILNNSDDGIERKGLILKLINSLKQICNSPAQFLNHSEAQIAESGKLSVFIELMREAIDSGEKILIFTQYTTMGNLLVDTLHNTLNLQIPFLHGGLSRKKRDEMVDNFQTDFKTRGLVLSLKAGGTGLNLTAASQVIHYDLWWNPAVEAQATDRAFRIGQKKNVQVHRLITENTFEEKIDAMIQDKKSLADLTVASGEKWITELSNKEICDLISL